MLRKLRNLLFIIVILAGIGYSVYYVFVIPAGFNDKEELIISYFDNIQSESLCDDHFNTETEDYCLSFQLLLDDKIIEVINLAKYGDNYLVTISVENEQMDFEISFITIEVKGLKSFLNSSYYLIDIIL